MMLKWGTPILAFWNTGSHWCFTLWTFSNLCKFGEGPLEVLLCDILADLCDVHGQHVVPHLWRLPGPLDIGESHDIYSKIIIILCHESLLSIFINQISKMLRLLSEIFGFQKLDDGTFCRNPPLLFHGKSHGFLQILNLKPMIKGHETSWDRLKEI